MTVRQVAITGAGRGIGREIARQFLASGWRVWALVRDPKSVEGLRESGDLHSVALDASNEGSVLDATRKLTAEAGHLTALVNNAGIAISAPLHKTTHEDFATTLMVNLTTPFLLCRELSPAMVKAGHGRIVNIASTAALRGFKYTSAYCASKHGLLGLTRSLALELAPKGVTVNAVCPGWTETDMFDATVRRVAQTTGRSEEESKGAVLNNCPLRRPVKASEVAELVHFLCSSEAATAITGAHYVIDGGETI